MAITVVGLKRWTKLLDRTEKALDQPFQRERDRRPLVDAFYAHENAVYRSRGRLTGAPWRPLKKATIKRKGHDRILEDTGALKDALTSRGGDNTVDHRRRQLNIIIDVPYAVHHQRGTTKMKPRILIKATRRLAQAIAAAYADRLAERLGRR